jgi:Helix-turn-helix domain
MTMVVIQAYRFCLDPTPAQEPKLSSHAGAERFAFNFGLGLVKERLDRRRAGERVEVRGHSPRCGASGTPPSARSRRGGRRTPRRRTAVGFRTSPPA